jgi:hypothetical protein
MVTVNLAGTSFRDRIQGRRMLGLIQPDLATAGEPYLRDGAPSCLMHFGAYSVLLRQGGHLGPEIVAHEVEFMGATIVIRRVECGLCWWEGEDQPTMTGIDGLKAEDIAEERSVRLGVFAVDDCVSAKDH